MNRHDDIKLLRINYLRGPNVWTYRSVLEVWLDLGGLEQFPSNLIPGFTERLTSMLPAVAEHHCGVGERGGFLQRLIEGTWAGHTLEHVVIELLNLAGMPTGFGQTRSTSKPGIYRMVFRARDEQVARMALERGHALLMAAINGDAFDVPMAVAKVRDKVDDCYLGPSTACIVAAATDRRIPHIRLNDGNLVQLGHGARQRRIWTAETDLTSAIAEGIASEKDLTKGLLKSCGVPVPEGIVVGSPEEAWDAAQEIGLPVVVKPTDGNHGRGVTLDLKAQADVEAAFVVAERHGSEVMVERFVRGHEHRLLVVGGKLVAAARGEAAWVIGDGRSNVVELVDAQINIDPRRGTTEDFPLGRIDPADDGAVLLDLQRQGLKPTDIPATGRHVLIQRNGNVAIDCTDSVHPEVAHAVSLAARVVGLDIAGVDVVAEDISVPLQEQNGAVVEVNAGPGLLMHLKPAEGVPRPVGRAIVDHLFPEPDSSNKDLACGRIPIVGVSGSKGVNTIARLVAWLMHLSGPKVGLACREGLFLDRRALELGDCAHWEAGHRLLMNPSVEAAVFENGATAILRDGLVYDRCQVGVVTDMYRGADLAEFDIIEDDQMFKVMRTQVDVVLADGVAVLNVDDERIVEMAALCDGEVIFYGLDAEHPALLKHAVEGGRSVHLHNGYVALATGAKLEMLTELGEITPWIAHTCASSADTLLAAIAAAWGMGLSADLITAGIETFDSEMRSPRGTPSSTAQVL